MGAIIISVKVPGSGQIFEIKVLPSIHVGELTQLLINAFDNLTDEDFDPASAVLCDGKTGRILNVNKTLESLGIVNGSTFLFI